jgi:hypothetical protein
MSEKVVNTIIYELGITNSIKERDSCAYVYLAKLCELNQLLANDFKIIRNKISAKLELHYINQTGQANKLSWMGLFHSHVSNEEKLRYAMLNSIHNHTVDADTPLLNNINTDFIAESPAPTTYTLCPRRKYMFKSVDNNFRDAWIAYYNLHNKIYCHQCKKTIEKIVEGTYGC